MRTALLLLAAMLGVFAGQQAEAASCPLYPIAISSERARGLERGAMLERLPLDDVASGFAFLSWDGAPDTPTLSQSLTPPGDASRYARGSEGPRVGDWVQGVPGAQTRQVFSKLAKLQSRYIVIPISAESRGRAGRTEHRVSSFAAVRVHEVGITGRGWLSLEWAGTVDCGRSAMRAASSSSTNTLTGVQPEREYQKRVDAAQNLARLDDRLFGDNVSLYNGSTAFEVTDIDVPGNSQLPVRLSRRLAIDLQPQGLTPYNALLGGLGNWDIDVPHIAATYPKDTGWASTRCSVGSVPPISDGSFLRSEIWQGISVHVPGRGTTSVLGMATQTPRPTAGGEYRYTSSERDVFACVPMKSGLPGEGFKMTTTEGVTYTFDVAVLRPASTLERRELVWAVVPVPVDDGNGGTTIVFEDQLTEVVRLLHRDRFYLLASKIEDRFGNVVDFEYNAKGFPTRIAANDGRLITLTYLNDRLDSASSHGRTWQFGYADPGDGQARLSQVTLPDSSQWTYGYTGSLLPSVTTAESLFLPDCAATPQLSEEYTLTATHPSGASGVFNFSNIRHARNGLF